MSGLRVTFVPGFDGPGDGPLWEAPHRDPVEASALGSWKVPDFRPLVSSCLIRACLFVAATEALQVGFPPFFSQGETTIYLATFSRACTFFYLLLRCLRGIQPVPRFTLKVPLFSLLSILPPLKDLLAPVTTGPPALFFLRRGSFLTVFFARPRVF